MMPPPTFSTPLRKATLGVLCLIVLGSSVFLGAQPDPKRLGVRLLQRTTRVVRATLDGEAYYRRCLAILQDMEDAEGAFAGTKPKGTLRIEVQGTLARHFLMPNLPDFFASHPDIELSMSESERWIDMIHEGVDCVLHFGHSPDIDMIERQVVILERLTCAAPDYIGCFGTPTDPTKLDGHRMVGLRSLTSGRLRPMQFMIDGRLHEVPLPMPAEVSTGFLVPQTRRLRRHG